MVFGELQTKKMELHKLQVILKIELGGEWILVRFRGTTSDKNTTTNDFEARSWSKMTPRCLSANYKRKKLNYKQLQMILKVELGDKCVHVRFRGTTNDKNRSKNNFEARSWSKTTPRSFSMNYKRYKLHTIFQIDFEVKYLPF